MYKKWYFKKKGPKCNILLVICIIFVSIPEKDTHYYYFVIIIVIIIVITVGIIIFASIYLF